MTNRPSSPALRVVPAGPLSTATDGDADPLEFLDDPKNLDDLVDKVVGRIERRVIDELERRGRRHRPGVF